MSDELDPLRRLRPDRDETNEPTDPWLLAEKRDDLMSTITQTDGTPRKVYRSPSIYPRLAYDDEVAALDFLTRAFGFRERREARMGSGTPDDSMLAWLEFGDGVVMIGRTETEVHQIVSPHHTNGITCMLNVAVTDVDAHYERAIAEGAEIVMEINDAFYGFRRYEALDPEGHRWHFHEPLEDVKARRGDAGHET